MADVSNSPSRPAEDDASVEEDYPRARSQPRSARRRANRKRQQGSGLPAVNEAKETAHNAISKAKGMTGSGPVQEGGEKKEGGGKDALSLRLDLNLEVELTLKLKVHGDLTLALLQ